MMNPFLSMLRDDGGATMVEYALVLSLIAIVAIAGLKGVYEAVAATLNLVTNQLAAAQSGS